MSSSRSCKTYKCQTDDYTSDSLGPYQLKFKCAVGYELSDSNRYCYKRVTASKTWAAAQAACRSDDPLRNTDLAVIGTQVDADFLDSQGFGDSWIGLNDITTEGVWLNVDGTTPTYTGWTGSEPNNGWGRNEDCTHYRSAKNWNDLACSSAQPFVCGHKAEDVWATKTNPSLETCCDLKPRMRCSEVYPIHVCPFLSKFDSSASCATYQCAPSDFSESDSGCCKVDVEAVLAAESAARAAAAAREAAAAEVAADAAKAISDAKAAETNITIVVVVVAVAFLICAVYVYIENEWELPYTHSMLSDVMLSGGWW